jgi:hypothetical protein
MENIEIIIEEKAVQCAKLWDTLNPDINSWDRAKIFCETLGFYLHKIHKDRQEKCGFTVVGKTNGKIIRLAAFENTLDAFNFFHDVGHYIIHYGFNRNLPIKQMEYEADLFAKNVCQKIWVKEHRNFELIAMTNPVTNPNLIMNTKGNKL